MESILRRLMYLPGFKMTAEYIEADGCCYMNCGGTIEDYLLAAYVFIESNRKARELVKSAKVVL